MATPRKHTRTMLVLGVMGAATLLLPFTAAAESHGYTNHRNVPNNACDTDTPVATFPDRSAASDAHQRSIDCVAHQDVTEGRDGQYHPHEDVTRGQMASFIARALEAAGDRDLPEDPDSHFDDTDGSAHEHRIDQLAEIGVTTGRTEDRYEPDGHVTRAQMATFLLRAASWNHTGEIAAYEPAGDDAYFLDIEGSFHADNIRAGYELALWDGPEPGEYAPNRDVHRGAMATFLTRLLDVVHPNAYETSNQTYLMSPAEPMQAPAGEPIEFSVDASRAEYTNSAEPLPGPVRQALHIALFPCDEVATAELPATFTDAAGDGVADAIGTTDTDQAYIRDVNGEPTEGQVTMVRNAPPEDGQITFTLIAPAADCTVAVAFDDRGPEDELRVDLGNRPAHAFGFVEAEWED